MKTHGYGSRKNRHPLYRVWDAMIGRCYRPKTTGYGNYGGRGISVCRKWRYFVGFLKDMGPTYRRGLTLERKNNDGNYCKSNCRWATHEEQNLNMRRNVMVNYRGKRLTVSQWALEAGINYMTLWNRLVRRGWGVERAFNQPIQKRSYA